VSTTLPHWTAVPILFWALVCLLAVWRADYIQTIAARMRPSPRQRLLSSRGYLLFVRGIALFAFASAVALATLMLVR
jgi:hypothetical protein